jgi:hypothetical protein
MMERGYQWTAVERSELAYAQVVFMMNLPFWLVLLIDIEPVLKPAATVWGWIAGAQPRLAPLHVVGRNVGWGIFMPD